MSAHDAFVSWASLYPSFGIGLPGEQVQPFVPSFITLPSYVATDAKSPINEGAAVDKVFINHSFDLPSFAW